MAALGPHWAAQVATSQPASFLNQSPWQRDNWQVKHSSHMTPTHRRQLARARTADLQNFLSNLNLPALLPRIFPGRTTPLVTGRCISNYPGTSELFQKISRLCLNMKMALMMLLVVSFKEWREIFEGRFCFILLFLLGSGCVIIKTAAINFRLKRYFC